MKRLSILLFSSWWLSPLCLLLCTGLWCGVGFVVAGSPTLCPAANILGRASVIGFGLFLVFCLTAVVRALVLRSWGRAAATFLATGVCVLISLLAAVETVFMISDDARFRPAATATDGCIQRLSVAPETHAESAETAAPDPHAGSAERAE